MDTFLQNRGDLTPALKKLIRSADHSVLGIGVAFATTIVECNALIHERMRAGIKFEFVCLSGAADFSRCEARYAQGPMFLERVVKASLEEMEKVRSQNPAGFSYHVTRECPAWRIYIADPGSDSPRGLLVFTGPGSNGETVAVYSTSLLASPFCDVYTESLEWMRRQLSRKVFVIHGHSDANRGELKALLQTLGVEPVVLIDEIPGGAAATIEKFEHYARDCRFAIALFTPDDLVVKDDRQYLQPRGNAIWEVGWFCAHLSRSRVVLITQGELPLQTYNSNLNGVLPYVFRTSVEELSVHLRSELDRAGLIA